MHKTCIFTGHRVIPFSYMGKLQSALYTQILKLTKHGFTRFGSGGALGFDLMAADIVLSIRQENPQIQLVMFLPCKDQDKLWKKENRLRYREIIAQADEVIYTGECYTPQCMHVRNRYMVDHADFCIAYLERETGGTAYTVRYAMSKGLEIYNLNDEIDIT